MGFRRGRRGVDWSRILPAPTVRRSASDDGQSLARTGPVAPQALKFRGAAMPVAGPPPSRGYILPAMFGSRWAMPLWQSMQVFSLLARYVEC